MKETVIGIVTFLVFYYFNFIILAGISSVLVPGGDAFIKSYVDPVYSGDCGSCGHCNCLHLYDYEKTG